MWREPCWWYLVYPGLDGAGDCDVVFAVEVRPRRPAIHSAVVPQTGRAAADDGFAGIQAAAGGLSPAL
jgi:hypothetical protein